MSHLRQVRNYKRLIAPVTYMVSSEDDVIDVDTTLGLAIIYIPNIQADATVDRKIFIADATSNAGANPITIITIGGNTINNVTSLVLSVNGISAEIGIVDRNRYLANLSTDDSSSGTLTGANNGLNVVSNTVKLGGALLTPTIITASAVNVLDIQDQYGSFFKTRDANANFSIADFGANVIAPTATNIFSYLAFGNSYDATTNVVVNFGSINSHINTVDTWNFGDYNTFDNSNVTFNIGRLNTYFATYSASVFGNFNTISNGVSTRVIGDSNVISNTAGGGAYVFGHTNNVAGFDSFIIGTNSNIDDNLGNVYSLGTVFNINGGGFVDAIVSLGFVNTINATSTTRGVYVLGDSNSFNDFVTYSTVIGESANFTRVDHSTALGIFTNLTDVTNVYTFGEGNVISDSTTITNFGTYNNISSSTNLGVFGNGNVITDNDKLYIGNNNKNVVVDGINGFVGMGITSPVHALHLVTNEDAPTSQKIHNTSNQSFASACLEFENNLGNQGWVCVPCEYYGFGWFDNSTIIGDLTVNAEQDVVFLAGNTAGRPRADFEKARITSDGDMGIGVIIPTARLHVVGANASGINQRLEPTSSVTEDTTGGSGAVIGAGTLDVETLAIDIDRIVTITSKLNCRKIGGAGAGAVGDGCGYIITATFKNIAGVVSQIGSTDSDHTAEDLPLNSVAFSVSGTNVLVQGINADTNDLEWTSISKIKK